MTQFNLAIATDSYKASHWKQFPPNTEYTFYYIESRGGGDYIIPIYKPILVDVLSNVPTIDQIERAKYFWEAHIGKDIFNYKGWLEIARLGYLPLRIKTIPEGTKVPTKNVIMTVENTDPRFYWLPGWVETLILQMWYPTTVCTRSYEIKQIIKESLERTGDPSLLPFKLHDFGFRGVSSYQSAMLGGMAHLVNFMGTDTTAAIEGVWKYYGDDLMPAFSIPAAEHSTITSWGEYGEVDAYRNMLNQFAKPGSLVAVVSDSYDIDNAVENIWGKQLKKQVIESGATVIIRPDSGEPEYVVARILQQLADAFGVTINEKGYDVLNNVRVIQGDGMSSPEDIKKVLDTVEGYMFSADNVAFGMGGGLLQQVNRDTYKFAMKCSAAKINDEWVDVFKQPKDDPWKKSKKGRLRLVKENDQYKTTTDTTLPNELKTVFEDGKFFMYDTFEDVRMRVDT